jgi:hypothetical protein
MSKEQTPDPHLGKQTDAAEGDRGTVEESIRIHERKEALRCESCGRKLNSEEELKTHAAECSAAKSTGSGSRKTAAGREEGEDRSWVSTP